MFYRSTSGGASWTSTRVPNDGNTAVRALSGGAAGDLDAVGQAPGRTPLVRHSTDGGASWPTATLPAFPRGEDHLLRGVWGASASDDFAVCEKGGVLRSSDGRGLADDPIAWPRGYGPTQALLAAVAGTASDDLYAVGPGGILLHKTR